MRTTKTGPDCETDPSLRLLHISFCSLFVFFCFFVPNSWLSLFEPPHDKTNKMTVRQAKTQISLGIRPVWSVFAVRSMGSYGPKLFFMWTSKTLIRLSGLPRLIWVFAGRTCHFVGFVMRRLVYVRRKMFWLYPLEIAALSTRLLQEPYWGERVWFKPQLDVYGRF